MTTCSICQKKISGDPYICQPDGTFVHVINSPLCSKCFRAWSTGDNEYLVMIIKERWSK